MSVSKSPLQKHKHAVKHTPQRRKSVSDKPVRQSDGYKFGNGIAWLWNKSKVLTTAIFICLAIALLLILDSTFTTGKILKGVSVGDLDVSNMTVEQATSAITEHLEPKLAATTVYIFADEETANSDNLDLQILESESTAELSSFEEAQKNKKLWITSAKDLEASIPASELADLAFAAGRGGNIFDRFATSLAGHRIEPYATFGDMPLTNLIDDINKAIGKEMLDYGVKINNGVAQVTEGHDGNLLDNSQFSNKLSSSLLSGSEPIMSFIAELQFTPMQINEESASLTCKAINTILPETVNFTINGANSVDVWRKTMMGWIETEPRKSESLESGYYLAPFINKDKSAPELIGFLDSSGSGNDVLVEYLFEGNSVFVQPKENINIPKVGDALDILDAKLFDNYRSDLSFEGAIPVDTINVEYTKSSDRLTLSEALSYGVVNEISTFTTKYINTYSTQGRVFNIHKAADLLNNSIAKANSTWSFNNVVGPCDEEHGFREAKVIEAGEYTTGIGGGICQVATTVFNAAYEAGMHINKRRNHSLYSSNYPAGRDAVIAYPNNDLIWQNDTGKDILVRAKYTDESLTVTLYGDDPQRTVETETGEWVEGKKFSINFEVDDTMAANASYVKTKGTNGMDITVKRIVKDKNGKVIITDTFSSSYSPITKVVVCGAGSDMEALKQKYQDPDKAAADKAASQKTSAEKPTADKSSSSSASSSSSSTQSSSKATTSKNNESSSANKKAA